MKKLNRHIAILLFLVTIAATLVSQTPALLDGGYSLAFKLVWVFPLAFMLLITPQSYLNNDLMPAYIFLLGFSLYCLSCQTLTGRAYLGEDLYSIAISLMVLAVSYNFWFHHGGGHILQVIGLITLVCGAFLAWVIYIDYLRGSDLMSASYAYGEKNSIASILLCCSFFVFMFYTPRSKICYWGSRFLAVFILVVMVMTRSRATLASGIYILYYFVFKTKSKRLRRWIVILSILMIAYLVLNANMYDLFVNGILLGGRDATDMNSISSNRLILFTIALQRIPQHPWIGSGDYYVDCMPLNYLTEYGIFGLIIVLCFLYYIWRKLEKTTTDNKVYTATQVMFFAFLVNALLEARPPFGPGTKCFFLWMLFGFALAEGKRNKEKSYEK